MSKFPNALRYSKSHEWVRVDDDNTATVGITDYAQQALGDLVFIELPEIDRQVSSGDEIAVVESVKTAADVYSPITGKIIAVNEQLGSDPSKINQDPYGDGWIYKIKFSDSGQINKLLDAETYQSTLDE